MKAYVCLAALAAFVYGCAYGIGVENEKTDSGPFSPKDSGQQADTYVGPQYEASTPDTGSTQDVTVTTPTCTSLPLSTGIAACDTCVAGSCCSQDQACGNDPDCLSFIDCISACIPSDGGAPDPNCETTCESTYPTGTTELSDLENCMSSLCRTDCGGP